MNNFREAIEKKVAKDMEDAFKANGITEDQLKNVDGGSVLAAIGIAVAARAVYDFVDGFVEGYTGNGKK